MVNIEIGPFQPMRATLQTMVLAHAVELVAHAVELAEVRCAREVQDKALPAARDGIIEQRFEIEAPKARLAKLLSATFGRLLEKLRNQAEQFELSLTDINEMLAKRRLSSRYARDGSDPHPSGPAPRTRRESPPSVPSQK